MPTCRDENCHLSNDKVCELCQSYFCYEHFINHQCVPVFWKKPNGSTEPDEFTKLKQEKKTLEEKKSVIAQEIHETRFAFLNGMDFFSQAKWLSENRGAVRRLVRLEKSKWVPNYNGWRDFLRGMGFWSSLDNSHDLIRMGWFGLEYSRYSSIVRLYYSGKLLFTLDTESKIVHSWNEDPRWVGDWLEMWNHIYSVVVTKLRKEVTLLEQEVQELEFNKVV